MLVNFIRIACVGILLIQIQISSSASERKYTSYNFYHFINLEHAKRCVRGVMFSINGELNEGIEYLNDICKDRDTLKKSDDFKVVDDKLNGLRHFLIKTQYQIFDVIDTCNDTHCPADIQEQSKNFEKKTINEVYHVYRDSAEILDNIQPGNVCSDYFKCAAKYPICYYGYQLYTGCLDKVEPVYHRKKPKPTKVNRIGEKTGNGNLRKKSRSRKQKSDANSLAARGTKRDNDIRTSKLWLLNSGSPSGKQQSDNSSDAEFDKSECDRLERFGTEECMDWSELDAQLNATWEYYLNYVPPQIEDE